MCGPRDCTAEEPKTLSAGPPPLLLLLPGLLEPDRPKALCWGGRSGEAVGGGLAFTTEGEGDVPEGARGGLLTGVRGESIACECLWA